MQRSAGSTGDASQNGVSQNFDDYRKIHEIKDMWDAQKFFTKRRFDYQRCKKEHEQAEGMEKRPGEDENLTGIQQS